MFGAARGALRGGWWDGDATVWVHTLLPRGGVTGYQEFGGMSENQLSLNLELGVVFEAHRPVKRLLLRHSGVMCVTIRGYVVGFVAVCLWGCVCVANHVLFVCLRLALRVKPTDEEHDFWFDTVVCCVLYKG